MGKPKNRLERKLKQNEPVEGVSREDVKQTLARAYDDIISEVSRSFDYFRDTTSYENIDEIILSGDVASSSDFCNALAERAGIEVNVADPFKNIEVPESFDREYLKKVSPIVTVAVGLALRRVGDK